MPGDRPHAQDEPHNGREARPATTQPVPDPVLAARAPFGVVELDGDGRLTALNPAFAAMVMADEATLLGCALVDLVHPDPQGACNWPADERTDTTWDVRLRSGAPSAGRRVRLHLSCRPDADGYLLFVEPIAHAEPVAWDDDDADDRYAKLLHNIDDVITVCDSNGVIQKNLGHFDQLLGWPARHWEGRSIFELAHPDEVEQTKAEFARLLDLPGVPVVRQFRSCHREQVWVWLELTAINMLDDPSVRAVIVISRNITTQKRVDALQNTQAEVLELIACGASLDIVLARLAQMVEDHTTGARVAIVLRDDNVLRLGAGQRLDPRLVDLLDGAPTHEWPDALRTALLGSQTFAGRVADTELKDETRAALIDIGVAAITAIPIVQERDADHVTGAVLVLLDADRNLSAHEDLVATNAARLAAIAVQRHRVELQLSHLAHHDKLTGLPNRALLQARLDDGIRHARAHQSSIGVMFLDLDNFKIVNDSLGHAAGDQILVGFAERVRKLLRPGDVLGRFGGDEFVVLLENVSTTDDAMPVAERLLDDLRRPLRIGDRTVFLSVSIGIAVSDKGRYSSEVLLRNADAAMYQAKAQGRSRIETYDDGLPERAATRLELEGDLHRALDAGQFVLHWQPKVSLESGRIVSAEALLRWNHPQRGLIQPNEFVSVTEELELINRIGEWVLSDAIRQRATWEAEHGDEAPWSIAVNVSALQLSAPTVVDTVERVLSRWHWAPERLVLELTESVLMDEVTAARALLRRLQHLGVKLAIDDFGTGYSSLSYLHHFPVDQVKLDRAFVTSIGADGEGSPIARAVIHMAHALGISVTAEGVETEAQMLGLRRLGCDRAQGFHIARPMPATDFSALLRTRPRYGANAPT